MSKSLASARRQFPSPDPVLPVSPLLLMGWSAPFHSHGLEGQNERGFTQRSRP